MEQKVIYLDNNATTPVDPRVLEAMMPYLTHNFANANSTHKFGVEAYNAVKLARKQVADLIGAEPYEIVFTSGATEAINQAIKGIAEAYVNKGKHIVTVATEHSAVLETCKSIEDKGYEITVLPVKSDGLLDLDVFKSSLRDDTIFASVMLVNNETGVIQPIKELAELTHKNGSLFITDATQAVGKMSVSVDDLGVDLLCFSGHKMYAPKGIGALYIRQRGEKIKLPALLHGGGQERGYRSGTLNVPGIVGLGEACAIALSEMLVSEKKIRELRNKLENELIKAYDGFANGNLTSRLFNTSNLCFPEEDANMMIDIVGKVAVSTGSACTSAIIEPSHVLTAMGLSNDDANASIRFSVGKFNTEDEIDETISLFKNL